MSTYDFYNLDTSDTDHKYTKQPEATPGDLPMVLVRRGWVNTVKQNLANADVGNAIPINAGEVVCDVYARVITDDDTSNLTVDIGFAGGTEIVADGSLATENAILANGTFTPVHFAADNAVTLSPTNGVAIDEAVVEVVAMITKSFDKS